MTCPPKCTDYGSTPRLAAAACRNVLCSRFSTYVSGLSSVGYPFVKSLLLPDATFTLAALLVLSSHGSGEGPTLEHRSRSDRFRGPCITVHVSCRPRPLAGVPSMEMEHGPNLGTSVLAA